MIRPEKKPPFLAIQQISKKEKNNDKIIFKLKKTKTKIKFF
jgi:hypothetical protein